MKALPVIAAALLSACAAAPAPEPLLPANVPLLAPETSRGSTLEGAQPRAASSRLQLRVERFWTEDGYGFATVRVRNAASYDLAKITVECTAIDGGDAAPRTARELLLGPPERPLPPGMERTRRVSFGRCESVESMTCEARAL